MKELLILSTQYGFTVEKINIRRPQEAKQLLAGRKPDALFMTSSSIAHMAQPDLISFADALRIPVVSLSPDRSASVAISLSSDPSEQGEKTADKVIKVLEGVPPERVASETSREVELVFNLKKAKAMGWKIPMELVASATKLVR